MHFRSELPAAAERQAGRLAAYRGPWPAPPLGAPMRTHELLQPGRKRASRLDNLDAAFDACEIRDGATLSFHHHFRNGDRVLNTVLECAARRGLKDLTIAASSIFPVHAPVVSLIRSGVVTRIIASYMRGPVADAVVEGLIPTPVVLQTHGGRARAIVRGELRIDVAFVGAPLCDASGSATGRGGALACGPLGYAMVDAAYATQTVVLANEISERPLQIVDIPGLQVDYFLPFPCPGDPAGIQSGVTIPSVSDEARSIAAQTVAVIEAAGLLRDGFSFQTGAGGFSLAAIAAIGSAVKNVGVQGGYISGGITGAHVDIAAAGLVRRIRDVQSFDLRAIRSSIENPWHEAMSADEYANPLHPAPAVAGLSVMLLGAAEIDADFNVNVILGGHGRIIGGAGGHPDAAAGSQLAIVTSALTGGGFAKVVDRVTCVATPGRSVDVLVTDAGIAVNPSKTELQERLRERQVPLVEIEELIDRANRHRSADRRTNTGVPCALVEDREGALLDVVQRL